MPTLEQAKKVHAAPMLDELEHEWAFLGAKVDRSHWRVTFPGGSWLQWVTAERARNIRGIRCDILSVDECDDVDESIYFANALPWLSEHHSLAIAVLSGTPTRGRYGLLYKSLGRALGWERLENGDRFPQHYGSHAPSWEFPEYVSPERIEHAQLNTPPEIFAREWECNFDAGEGLVYPHFREASHVRLPHPETEWREYIVGVDWGWEDPTVFLVFGVAGHGRDTQIHLLAEYVERHKTITELTELARRVDMLYPDARWYADPSRPGDIESLRRPVNIGPDGYNRGGAGVRIVAADNAIDDGVSTVADTLLLRERPDPSNLNEAIGWSQLLVHPDCVHTIREFGLYRRKRDSRNRDRVLDDIEDKNNHCMDAGRYALHTHFGSKDKRVSAGYSAR